MGPLAELGPRDVLDILVVAVAFYAVIRWLRQARAGLAVVGASLLGLVYLVALELRLTLTARIFQGFFAVFVIILAVILQNDLRRLFERVARWRPRTKQLPEGPEQIVELLGRAVSELASQRRGALIVVPGRDSVERWAEGGVPLEGRVSHPLLVSLFDPGSPGHDGAAILEGNRVTRFGAHLPLSRNFDELAVARVTVRRWGWPNPPTR